MRRQQPRSTRASCSFPTLRSSVRSGWSAKTLNVSLEHVQVPPALPAIVVALISASPEILTALRAALANRMQSVVNIALGASLSTVILTVPLMEALALYTGQPFDMAMTPIQTMMVLVTLIVTAIKDRKSTRLKSSH